jgi:predicted DNA-binding transcriptional regulator AlpA
MLEVKDVMSMMGICKPKAYEVFNSGEFHVVKLGRKYMVHKEIFENWLKGEKTIKKKARW